MTARRLDVGTKSIGEGAPVFLIAELSANHAGKRDIALRTIEAAAKAGADAIKVQTYTPDTLTLKSDSPAFVVKTKNEWAGRTLYDLYAEAMTPWEWHADLKACAEANGLAFFSTPFDATAVELLESLGADAHKIASFEIVDLPLVEHVARRQKPMIISTGMASLGEIEAAVATCRAVGNDRIALLRCVSSYPARPEAMNLQSFEALKSFGTIVGLSDHTRDSTVAIASVVLGAKLIEKHFILDRGQGGPDAFFSLEPGEFRAMVDVVRAAEKAMGPPRFGVSEDEIGSANFRRSLWIAEDVRAGDVLTRKNVRSVRPVHGLDPKELPRVLGRVASRDVSRATPLSWDMVGPRSSPAEISLRSAVEDDSERVLSWRNDPLTRKMSVNQAKVTQAEHDLWYARALSGDARIIFIAERERKPVGQVGLSRDATSDRVREVGILVAPEARGRGLGATMLLALEAHARELGVVTLTARIRKENEASIRAFEKAGYYAFVERTEGDAAYWFCERSIVE